MTSQREPPFAERLYRGLLLVYPYGFRRAFGEGMAELFLSRYAKAREGGRRARMRFWLETLTDLCESATLEQLDSWRARSMRPRRKETKLDTLLQDLKLSIRRILDAPGFACVALLIVGLGIGVNVAMYGIVEAILFRPPPWERHEQLVWVYQDSDDGEPSSCSYPAYRDIAAYEDIFSNVAAIIPGRSESYSSPRGDTQLVNVTYATSSLFPVLGLTPSRGRWLEDDADRPGGVSVAVLSHHAWQRRFASDPGVVGQIVRLSGAPVTVIGVGPEGYRGEMPGVDTDFWLSISAAGPVGGEFYWSTLERREDHWFLVVGRMRENINVFQTQQAMNTLAKRLASEYPDLNEGRDITVFPADRVRVHPEYDALLFPTGGVLLAVAGLVLLVACANLANLLLARASARSREIAVRLSMGATRWRLVRQLLTESTVLSAGGGLLGLLLAFWAGRALAGYQSPLPMSLNLQITLDSRLLLFAAALSFATGLLFGLAPALRSSSSSLVPGLKERHASTLGRTSRWFGLRNVLVSMQVATSIVLLVGAGLLIRSLVNAESVDLGFAPERLAILEADAGEAGYEGEGRRALFRDLRNRVHAMPGVQHVALTTRLPVTPQGGSSTLEIEGYEPPAGTSGTGKAEVIYALVDADYFETLQIPLLHGRVFDEADAEGKERIALVNESFARRYWGRSNGVGRRYRHEGDPDSWVRVVGVVGDAKVRTPDEPPTPIFYRPLIREFNPSRLFVVARTAGDPAALTGLMREELRALDADVPVYQAGTGGDHVAAALRMPRTAASTLALLGGLALALATMGLYAVVSFAVSRRTSEIGIRMALGATGRQVVATVTKETILVAGAGVGIGLVASLFAMPVLNRILFNVSASDPLTFAAVALFMTAVASLAAYLPARRAALTDPVKALRIE